jgi:two-component system, NarL family, invasion response regulator UvrY
MIPASGDISAVERRAVQAEDVSTLVVDDQESFRDVMCELVAATPGFDLVGEAVSGEAALAAVGELSPQLVLMDVRMPGIGGIEASRALARGRPDLAVVLISAEEFDGVRSMLDQCGAIAFVRKQDLRPHLLRELWSERGGD